MNMFKPLDAKTPEEYLNKLSEPRKTEVKKIHDFIRKTLPKQKPYIEYGMIGYGKFHYKSRSGREGDWALVGLASQKNYISIYACASDGKEYVAEKYKEQLPKTNIGKSCIRVTKIDNLDFKVLEKLLKETEKLGGFFSG
jgi:hypothetical protein